MTELQSNNPDNPDNAKTGAEQQSLEKIITQLHGVPVEATEAALANDGAPVSFSIPLEGDTIIQTEHTTVIGGEFSEENDRPSVKSRLLGYLARVRKE